MSPDFYTKWSHIIQDVDKQSIPMEFIKKIIVKLDGRKQQTINIEKLLKTYPKYSLVEEVVTQVLHELEDRIVSMEFVLNVESIAESVQPETDKLLSNLR